MDEQFIRYVEEQLDNHERRIVDLFDQTNDLTAAMDEQRDKISSKLSVLERNIDTAISYVIAAADDAAAGKPDGYDETVQKIETLYNKYHNEMVPVLLELQEAGIPGAGWTWLVNQMEQCNNSLNNLPTIARELGVTELGLVSSNDGADIRNKIKDFCFIHGTFVTEQGSLDLTGWAVKDRGLLISLTGETFSLTVIENNIIIRPFFIKQENDSGISKEARLLVETMVDADITAKQLVELQRDIIAIKSLDKVETLKIVDLGLLEKETGGKIILEKTEEGLQTVKLSLGGLTLIGPMVREKKKVFGLLTDQENNVWNVNLSGYQIIAHNLGAQGELISNNLVSADMNLMLQMLQDVSREVSAINNPAGDVPVLKETVRTLQQEMDDIRDTADAKAANQDLKDLLEAVGTNSKIEGKSLLQILLDLKHDVNQLKTAADQETKSTSTVDDSVFDYSIAVSEQHKIFLKIIRTLLTATKDLKGDALITHGLISSTPVSIANWKTTFVNNAVWSDDINSFLNSFGVNLTNLDTGSILGEDTGSGTSYKKDDVILSDISQTLVYPPVNYTFNHEDMDPVTMRTTKKEGLQLFVQPLTELSVSKQETMSKIVNWYLPASLKLIEQATSLGFNSKTSALSKIRLKSTNGFVTFDKKGLILVYDIWPVGIGVRTPGSKDLITVNSVVIDPETKKAVSIVLDINGNYYSKVTGNNGIGVNGVTVTLDRALCLSLVEAVMATNISEWINAPLWFREGIAGLIVGYDDLMSSDITELLLNRTRLERALSINSKDEWESWENQNDTATAGYLLLRYILYKIEEKQQQGVTPAENLISPAAVKLKQLISHMATSRYTVPAVILDNAIASTNKFATVKNLTDSFVEALQRSINRQESYTTFLEKECGIILFNEDNGSILGYDAGGEEIITANNLIWTDQDTVISYPTNFIHLDGYPSYFRYIDNTLFMFPNKNELTDDEQYTLGLISSKILPAVLGLIKVITGLSFNRLSKGIVKVDNDIKTYNTPFIFVTLDNNGASPYVLTEDEPVKASFTRNSNGLAESINLTISSQYYSKIVQDNPHGISDITNMKRPLDTLILQEMVKAAIAVNIAGTPYPFWFTEGLANLITGADAEMVSTFSVLLTDIERTVIALSDITDIAGFTAPSDPSAAGYALWRYLMKQF